jgi:hypothetical protein
MYMYSPTCFLSLVPAVDVYVQSNLFSQSCSSSGCICWNKTEKTSWTVHIHPLLEQDWENKLDCTYTSTAGTRLRKQVGLYIYTHCWYKTKKTSWIVHIHPLLVQDWENKLDCTVDVYVQSNLFSQSCTSSGCICTVRLVFLVLYQQWMYMYSPTCFLSLAPHCWCKTEKTSWTVHIHPLLVQD